MVSVWQMPKKKRLAVILSILRLTLIITNVFEDNMWDAWMFVAKDKSAAVFTFVQVLGRPNYHSRRVKLKGLDPAKNYKNHETGEVHSGAALMNCGINVNVSGDFTSMVVFFTEE